MSAVSQDGVVEEPGTNFSHDPVLQQLEGLPVRRRVHNGRVTFSEDTVHAYMPRSGCAWLSSIRTTAAMIGYFGPSNYERMVHFFLMRLGNKLSGSQ